MGTRFHHVSLAKHGYEALLYNSPFSSPRCSNDVTTFDRPTVLSINGLLLSIFLYDPRQLDNRLQDMNARYSTSAIIF
jgi:hypothetical protein